MTCPRCGATESIVVDTRSSMVGRANRRRRECPEGHRYTTYEVETDRDVLRDFLDRQTRTDPELRDLLEAFSADVLEVIQNRTKESEPCLTIRWC